MPSLRGTPLAVGLAVSHWPAFWIVACPGLIQVLVTYYSSTLAIESLPVHVPEGKRRRHKRVFAALFVGFVGLTLLLAKLNDTNQRRAEAMALEEQHKREDLQLRLERTLRAVLESQEKLQEIKVAVDRHAPSGERSAMLRQIDSIQRHLGQQAGSVGEAAAH